MPVNPSEIVKNATKIVKNIQTEKIINQESKSLSPHSHFSTQPANLDKYQRSNTQKRELVEQINNIATSLKNRPDQISNKLAAAKIYTAHKSRKAKTPEPQNSR